MNLSIFVNYLTHNYLVNRCLAMCRVVGRVGQLGRGVGMGRIVGCTPIIPEVSGKIKGWGGRGDGWEEAA